MKPAKPQIIQGEERAIEKQQIIEKDENLEQSGEYGRNRAIC